MSEKLAPKVAVDVVLVADDVTKEKLDYHANFGIALSILIICLTDYVFPARIFRFLMLLLSFTQLVDNVTTIRQKTNRKILLVNRKYEPFKDCWALPGGHVEPEEPLIEAAVRELKEETNVSLNKTDVQQVHTFGNPGRDPRGWYISIAYFARIPSSENVHVQGMDDAKEARWFSLDNLPELAFDHEEIIRRAKELYCK
jgi:8-oxo-dGTP diphosphatase